MTEKRKNPHIIKYELKLKVLRDDEEKTLTKAELAKLHGISVTSVARILNRKDELLAMKDSEVDPDKRRVLKIKTPKTKTGKIAKPKIAIAKQKKIKKEPLKEQSFNIAIQPNDDKEEDEDDEEEEDVPSPQILNAIPEYDDPEASFERALKQLEDYTVQLLGCDLLIYSKNPDLVDQESYPPVYDSLYELYEELMESEFRMRNAVC